jgi:hypothetical protein
MNRVHIRLRHETKRVIPLVRCSQLLISLDQKGLLVSKARPGHRVNRVPLGIQGHQVSRGFLVNKALPGHGENRVPLVFQGHQVSRGLLVSKARRANLVPVQA